MVPVGEAGGGMTWGCTNPWHPRDPGPCPTARRVNAEFARGLLASTGSEDVGLG